MAVLPRYPFSDLSSKEVQAFVEEARAERIKALRTIWSAVVRFPGQMLRWPPRQREAQVWPPNDVAALRLTVYS